MYLNTKNIAYYLLERGLITPKSLVEGDFLVVEISRRNRNFKVIRLNQPGYFVKQVKTWETQAISSLQREANCYLLAQNDPDFASLAPLLTEYHLFDQKNYVLVTKLIPGATSLQAHLLRTATFPENIARQLGEILGTYHRHAGKNVQNHYEHAIFPKSIPWILSIHHQDPRSFYPSSAGGTQVISLIQGYPDLHRELDVLRNQWKYNSLLHGDMKWDNFIVYPNSDTEEDLTLKLVDWELADIGDADWDAGSVLQSFLSFWIMSLQITGEQSMAHFVDLTHYPLEDMQPAIRSFWNSYTETMHIPESDRPRLLKRCVKFGAARMLQTAYEYMYQAPQLSPNVVCLLQASLNILQNTEEAIDQLLGMGSFHYA